MNIFMKRLLNAVLPDPQPPKQIGQNELDDFSLNTSSAQSKSNDKSPYALYSSENWHWHTDNE
ncbi:hypothetical protein HQN64_24000 [Enterobacteriaceae bacterium BIT-l23]|uniref:hypothetical protein n=1 Tax=Jejubacter sp. L23 TaxID=3092086 RepID=UPI001584ABA8|nr:hypothetical protein [Enterobacteriaceae bacterium BIT-l23]